MNVVALAATKLTPQEKTGGHHDRWRVSVDSTAKRN